MKTSSPRPARPRRTLLLAVVLPLAIFALLPVLAPTQAAYRDGRPLSAGQRTALLLLRETVELVEESYVTLPDMKKVYAAGFNGLRRGLGEDRLEVDREDARHFVLRAGEEKREVHLGAGADRDLASFEEAYLFVVSLIPPREREHREVEVMFAALGHMVSSLDPFSAFMSPERFRQMRVETSGRYGGIGVTITIREKKLTVVSPIEDTPAFRAGLQPGDVILAVDGEPTLGLPLSQIVTRMRGPPGTEVRLTVSREGWKAPRDFTLVRATIQIRSVKGVLYEGGFGYLRVTTFHSGTTHELDREMERLIGAGVRGIVLDLRNNPGGLLHKSVQVAERFLPEGSMVVFTRGRHRSQTLHFRTRSDGVWVDKPLIVLINRGSASASEIVAGALQDLDRALLVGETTFGKGSVQTIIPISRGAGVRLTTAMYFTPLGRLIHNKGIRPDLEAKDRPRAGAPATPGEEKGPPASPPRGEPWSYPPEGSDPPLEIALQILRETDGPDIEALRMAALRVRAQRMEGGIPKAQVPAGRRAR